MPTPSASVNLPAPQVPSVQVLEVHWRGELLWGTIEILPTPSGLLLWELYSQVRRLRSVAPSGSVAGGGRTQG